MKENKPIKEKEIQKKPKPIVEKLEEFEEFKNKIESGEIKRRSLRLPSKAKVRKSKLKKGYVGILKIDENRNMTAEKQMVSGFGYKTGDNIYHATNGSEIFFWNGRYPIIIQPSWKENPIQLDPDEEANETYGQPYIRAKMLSDTIKVKAKKGNLIIWILLGVAVLIGINYLAGGNLFG